MCGYYFKMTHIITNLKCHISYNSSTRYTSLAGGRNAKIYGYGGRVEKIFCSSSGSQGHHNSEGGISITWIKLQAN